MSADVDFAHVTMPVLVASFAIEFAIAHWRSVRRQRRRDKTRLHITARLSGHRVDGDCASPVAFSSTISTPPARSNATVAATTDTSDYANEPVYRLNSTLDSLSLATLNSLVGTFTKALAIVPYTWLWHHHRIVTIPDSWMSWCAMFVLMDFCYYWMHRCAHEWNWAWASHSVHHGSEDFNLTVGVRQGALQQLASWMFYLPCSIIGMSPRLYNTISVLHVVYQFYMHTKLVPKLGVLEKIFSTPSQHRVHHGRNPYCIDKNYGGTLCIWDRLFGTFAEENVKVGDEPVKYGLVHAPDSMEPIWQNVMHWATMRDTVAHLNSIIDKLEVIWQPPSWRPKLPPVKAPPTEGCPNVRCDPQMSPSLKIYCVVQLLMSWYPALALASGNAAKEYAWPSLVACVTASVWGMSSVGSVISASDAAHVWRVECVRLVVMAVAVLLSLVAMPLAQATSPWTLLACSRDYAALWPPALRVCLLPLMVLSALYAVAKQPLRFKAH